MNQCYSQNTLQNKTFDLLSIVTHLALTYRVSINLYRNDTLAADLSYESQLSLEELIKLYLCFSVPSTVFGFLLMNISLVQLLVQEWEIILWEEKNVNSSPDLQKEN